MAKFRIHNNFITCENNLYVRFFSLLKISQVFMISKV